MSGELTHERFRLTAATLAIAPGTEWDDILHVSADEEIVLLRKLNESDIPNRMVAVLWNGRNLKMFAVDILERGERL